MGWQRYLEATGRAEPLWPRHAVDRLVHFAGTDREIAEAAVELWIEESKAEAVTAHEHVNRRVKAVVEAVNAGRDSPLQLKAGEIDWRPEETVPEDFM